MEPYVLVVDDFPDGADMLAEYLRFRGLQVVTATDGAEAIEIAIAQPPKLILMDLTMPGIDGWEATRRLKAHPQTKDVLVIAVTANAFAHDEAKARAAGVDGFVVKPLDIKTLGDNVTAIMRSGRTALTALRKRA